MPRFPVLGLNRKMDPAAAVLILLFLITGLTYVPALSGDYVLNDVHFVFNSAFAQVRRWHRFFYDAETVSSFAGNAGEMYRPLTTLSFAAHEWLGLVAPFWYHLVSLFLHAANACLVFLIAVHALEPETDRADRRGLLAGAAGAALLFGLHPVQVESVAYIGARAGLLSFFFCAVSLLLYVQPREGPRARAATLASLACYAMGLLTKESAVSLWPVLVACDWCLPGGGSRPRSSALRRNALHGLLVCAFIAARYLVLGRWSQRGWWGGSFLSHAGYSVYGLSLDIRNVVWPFYLRDCYGVAQGFGSAWIPLALSLLWIVAAAFFILGLWRRRWWGAAGMWVLAGLAPVSNLFSPITALAADRFLYVPMVGFALLWGRLLSRGGLFKATVAAAVLAGGLGFLCLKQQPVWANQLTLDQEAYAAAPGDSCAVMRLAYHYYAWGDYERSEELLRRSLARDRGLLRTAILLSLAQTELSQRRFGDAVRSARRAWTPRGERRTDIHRLMGLAWMAQGRFDLAREAFRAERYLTQP